MEFDAHETADRHIAAMVAAHGRWPSRAEAIAYLTTLGFLSPDEVEHVADVIERRTPAVS